MSKITYVAVDGARTIVDVADGTSVMQAAVSQGVPGIVGECGGSLMCSTCHVYVDAEFTERTGQPGDEEDEMLDATAAERESTSRLGCQIRMSPELDGLVVHTPASQY